MGIATSSGGRQRRGDLPTLSEMNVIPLVDVVLVLLIIFMLTASVMEFGVKVEVPKTRAAATSAQNLPVLEMNRTGELFLNGKAVNINVLGEQVAKQFPDQKQVYLRIDKEVTWDTMAQVVAALREAKIAVNLVTKPIERK
jgi:biopolymer transport protein ExbD